MGIEVVCAFIFRNDEVWMGRRPLHKHMGGCLEFPGGKVDIGETHHDALKRELIEELLVDAEVESELVRIEYHYPDKTIFLTAYAVQLNGEIKCTEHTEGVWIPLDADPQPHWAPADIELWNQFQSTRTR